MFLEDLGRRLRERRESRKLTQLDVANALGVSPQAVSKWERGENAPDVVLLRPLARVLGVTADWVLGAHEQEGDELEATVWISSVRGFTARSAAMRPAAVAMWANGFLHQATEAVLRHAGVPVKYLGDGLLAFFAGAEHRARAERAAVDAREVVTDELVVGLASGPVHLTAIGHPSYARPDILGSTVNLAFRVHGWAQANAAARIASAGDGPGASLVALKGITEPVAIREVAGA